MTTNPTPIACSVRPTGAGFARHAGFAVPTAGEWFTTDHVAAKAHKATTAIATYPHRRPGEDAPH